MESIKTEITIESHDLRKANKLANKLHKKGFKEIDRTMTRGSFQFMPTFIINLSKLEEFK